jgi:two-component system, OmpR family, sensor kinase
MIRSRLYLKIYLTVLGSLALVVILLTAFAMMGRLDTRGPFEDRVDRFATVMLAENMTKTERQAMLDRLSRALDADIAIFDTKGHLVQGAGEPIPAPDDDAVQRIRPRYRAFNAVLPDGSHMVAYVRKPFSPPRHNLIFTFLLIATAVGIVAYPVVRNLTKRLDALRQSMQDWGHGNLQARALVSGRDEVATVATTFNQAADRIEALVQSQKSLLANASHELRSPLARLRMATEMFALNQNEKTEKEIIRNLAELDELVEEILLKSRLGNDQPFLLDQPVDLLALSVEEAARVDAEVDGDSVIVRGNEKLLRRLIRNLLQNAARHGRPPITLNLSSYQDRAVITVRDHGDGLKPEEMTRIFEPFFRPEGRSESDGGWGLGLALVAEIARLHGGKAYAAQPDSEKGACFVVEIAKDASGRFV